MRASFEINDQSSKSLTIRVSMILSILLSFSGVKLEVHQSNFAEKN